MSTQPRKPRSVRKQQPRAEDQTIDPQQLMKEPITVGPHASLDGFSELFGSLYAYQALLCRLPDQVIAPAPILAAFLPVQARIVELQSGENEVGYSDILDLIKLAHGIMRKQDRLAKNAEATTVSVATFPVQPAVPACLMPTLFSGLPPVPPVGPPPLTPAEFEHLLRELEAALRELWNRLTPEQRRLIQEHFLRVWAAINAARAAGAAGMATAIDAIGQAMRGLIWRLARMGIPLEGLFGRLVGILGRFVTLFGGGAAGAAGGGAAGFVLLDALLLMLFLAMWLWLWVKIGTWFWNRPIPGGGGKTYVDFWSDVIYDLMLSDDCDKLLEAFRLADRRVRDVEQQGMSGPPLHAAAAIAISAATLYLGKCPTSIGNVVRARISHYLSALQTP